jgi:hypothetical protein
MVTMGSRRSVALATVLIAAAILTGAASARAQNLLRNGDFSQGSGNTPAYWHTQSWIDLPTTQFIWIGPSGSEPGMVAIENHLENDSYWFQRLHLDPGWYFVGAQARAECSGEGKGPVKLGALVSITDLGVVSNDLIPANADWQYLTFYLKVGDRGADVEVALRLSCFSGYQNGQALFRGASVVRVDAPPAGGRLIDLDEARDHFGGKPWTLLLLVVPLLLGAVAGWRLLPPRL